jgi:hypothetical protein
VRCICLLTAAVLAGFWFSSAAQADSPLSAPISISLTPPPADDTQTNLLLTQNPAPPTDASTPAPVSNFSNFFSDYFARVNQAQASQPHWMTPLVTVTPRLEQEVRYDQYWQNLGNGGVLDTYGSGKGLELIPTTTNEVLINPPAYQERYNKKPASGWADDQFLIIKQRLLSANEQNGNYIVTAFLGFTAPTGTPAFTNRSWIITPTLAGGKGWGDFNIQATVGIPVPLAHQDIIGTSIATNVALQFHVLQYFWPEFEMNYTYWANGLRGGKNQIFLTPGLILGRFEIHDRVRFIIGAGYQFAVSPALTKEPVLTPTYDRAWILTARLTF